MGGMDRLERNKGTYFYKPITFLMASTLKNFTSSQKLGKTKKILTPETNSQKEITQTPKS